MDASTAMLDWAVATRTLPGEPESGDLHVVAPFPGGALVGVVDGLGHGPEAAAASRLAVEVLTKNAHLPLDALVRRCHETLRGTRGAVMSLVAIRTADATMTWLGVGNVEAVLIAGDTGSLPSRAMLLTRGGVVGGDLAALRPATIPVAAGDVLCLATDGIDPAFAAELPPPDIPVQRLADGILSRYGRRSDDALILVARLGALRP